MKDTKNERALNQHKTKYLEALEYSWTSQSKLGKPDEDVFNHVLFSLVV
jgi:hypothetical protein